MNEASRALKVALGKRAPSRITLHRHSQAGSLRHLVCRSSGKRHYYDLNGLVAYYRQARPEGTAPTHQPSPHATGVSRSEIASYIEASVQRAMAPVVDMLTRVDRGLADLAATRSQLMMKYDAENSNLGQRLAAAKQDIDRLRGESSSEQAIMRMRLDISRLIDAFNNSRG